MHNLLINIRPCFFFCLLAVCSNASALLPFESTGNLYVSMWDADEIAVFAPDGTELERFTVDGLDGPRGIAFNPANGEIWIAGEFSNAIYIFDSGHQLLRTLAHEDFDEPVGVTFTSTEGVAALDQLVYVSNSNGNEIMVFNQTGVLQRRFSAPDLRDPNCSAFMQDGSFFVSNRLGGSDGALGSVAKFDAQESFSFDFTTSGISSLMAVARDSNIMPTGADDTVWVTSGGGDQGIYEFDQDGNLLKSLLPGDFGDGRNVVPQGIAFDSTGDFYVASFLNEVLKFDADGNFMMRFATGDGSSRSIAFQGCQQIVDGSCVPFGGDSTTVDSDAMAEGDVPEDQSSIDAAPQTMESDSGGGAVSLFGLTLLALLRRRSITILSSALNRNRNGHKQ